MEEETGGEVGKVEEGLGEGLERKPFAGYRRQRWSVTVARNQLATNRWYSQSPRGGNTMRVIHLALITAVALLALLLAAVAVLRS